MTLIKKIAFLFQFTAKINKSYSFIFSVLLGTLLGAVEPFVYLIFPAMIIDTLMAEGNSWMDVLAIIGVFIVCVVLVRLFRIASQVFTNMVFNKCNMKSSLFLISQYLHVDYEKLEDDSFRDQLQTLLSNFSAGAFISKINDLLTSLLLFIGYSYLILRLNFWLLVSVLVVVVLNYLISKRRKKNNYEYQPTLAKFNRRFDYLFASMINFDYAKEVRLNEAASLLSEKFQMLKSDFAERHFRFLNNQLFLNIAENFVAFIQMIISYGYIAYMAVAGKITVGSFSMYVGAVYNLSGAFSNLAVNVLELRYFIKYVDEYKKCMEEAVPQGIEQEINPLPDEDEALPMFTFENVCFTYPHTNKEILHNINLNIKKGEKLSIVGLNGAGKTTLIKLLCRIYYPTSGHIYYYGTDISTIKRGEYQKLLAVVFQDFKVFSFSFLENIVLNQEINKNRLCRSIQEAGLEQRVEKLPGGAETNIYKDFDENGVELSGGEGHKLAIARAYYKDAPFVILDEPTADFDAVAEYEMYQKFNHVIDHKTAIFISHRLSSTRFCDAVAVFADGKIAEYGSHQELLAKGGLYCEMFEKQAQYYQHAGEGKEAVV